MYQKYWQMFWNVVCPPPPCYPGRTRRPPRRPPGSPSPSPTCTRLTLRKCPGDKKNEKCTKSVWCRGEYSRGQWMLWLRWEREHCRDHLQRVHGPPPPVLSIPWKIQGEIGENEEKKKKKSENEEKKRKRGKITNPQSWEDRLNAIHLNIKDFFQDNSKYGSLLKWFNLSNSK